MLWKGYFLTEHLRRKKLSLLYYKLLIVFEDGDLHIVGGQHN